MMTPIDKILRLALIGFGNAGRAFALQLSENKEKIYAAYGFHVSIVSINTGSRGAIYNSKGLDIHKHLDYLKEYQHFDPSSPDFSTKNSLEMISQGDYDVMVELSPLEIFSGRTAISHIETAFNLDKHVITANKGPIAWDYHRLTNIAKKRGLYFYYETTVMDGTPLFNLFQETLKLCQVTEFEGILNSTTNFILCKLAEGQDYPSIIADGRRRGFIEEDSSLDIEGWDAAAKVTALANVLMGAQLSPLDIDRTGIENISTDDIASAQADGKVIKLMCRGFRQGEKVHGIVEPHLVPMDSIYATIQDTSSILSITTDLMGTVTIVEENPEIEQTAYGVLSDLLRLISKLT